MGAKTQRLRLFLKRETAILLKILFSGGVLILAGVILLFFKPESTVFTENLCGFGISIMLYGYPGLIFARLILSGFKKRCGKSEI